MFGFIEKLRLKSDRTKKQIAFLVSFIFVGIIFTIWLSVILPDFRQRQIKENSVARLEPSPLSSFGNTFSVGLKAIGEEFNKIKESISKISTKPPSSNATTTSPVLIPTGQ